MPINDLTGVPIYDDAADAKAKLSLRIKEECERRILEVCLSGVNEIRLLI